MALEDPIVGTNLDEIFDVGGRYLDRFEKRGPGWRMSARWLIGARALNDSRSAVALPQGRRFGHST